MELPERKVFIQHITLSEEERKIYQSVKNEGKATIGRYGNKMLCLIFGFSCFLSLLLAELQFLDILAIKYEIY